MRWLRPTWHPAIRQRQFLKRQRLSKPGLWRIRLNRGRRRGDERGTPPDYDGEEAGP